MQLKEIRESKNLKSKELAEKVGIDVAMMSRFENYKCLPIPKMLDTICDVLECDMLDIYDADELFVKPKAKGINKCSYRLSVRLPANAKYVLDKCLETCGYRNITYWIMRCYERLQAQYEIIIKAKQKASAKTTNQDTEAK